MLRLLSANLRRLWINKAFWVTAIVMMCGEVLFCYILSMQTAMPMDFVLFISLQGIGVLTSVFFSLFLGTEFSDGTIRNKLIVGHKRSSIYLASLITGGVAVTIVYLAGVLAGGVVGTFMFASPHYSIGQILLAGGVGWLACIAYISIFNLVGMLSSSKAKTSIICIMVAFVLIFVGLLCYSLTMQGVAIELNQMLLEINPFGQTIQAMVIDVDSPLRVTAYSLILSAALTVFGVCAFNRKDLK